MFKKRPVVLIMNSQISAVLYQKGTVAYVFAVKSPETETSSFGMIYATLILKQVN